MTRIFHFLRPHAEGKSIRIPIVSAHLKGQPVDELRLSEAQTAALIEELGACLRRTLEAS